jgi:hypothetical protein
MVSKILDKLVQEDDRIESWQRDIDNSIFLYLNRGYVCNECYTIFGSTVKEILSQLKYIEKGDWD